MQCIPSHIIIIRLRLMYYVYIHHSDCSAWLSEYTGKTQDRVFTLQFNWLESTMDSNNDIHYVLIESHGHCSERMLICNSSCGRQQTMFVVMCVYVYIILWHPK